jgi:hypothetical protein
LDPHLDLTKPPWYRCGDARQVLAAEFEAKFASALETARAERKQALSGGWLITDVFLIGAVVGSAYSRDLRTFAVAIDAVPRETRDELSRLANSALGRVTAALSTVFDEARFGDMRRVAAAYYSRTTNEGKLRYELHIEIGQPKLLLASPVDETSIQSVITQVRALPKLGIETALRLYKDALEEYSNPLRAFITGWAALEILVNKMFTEHYDLALLVRGQSDENGWIKGECNRLSRLERGTFQLEDRFAFLAVWLDCRSSLYITAV